MITFSPAAVRLLANLREIGIELKAHGDELRYRSHSAMTSVLLQQLQSHKADLLAFLRASPRQQADAIIEHHRDFAERLAEVFEERVAIAVEDGKQSEQTAEEIALHQLLEMVQAKGGNQ